jgi:HD-like signal output (HDOD) protein
MSADNALWTLLTTKIRTNQLVLPTLPEIAVRVRQAADDPDINLHAMSEVIALDPALSARMLKVANSAFLGRTIKVNTLNQAVTRIGLNQVKNIATAMALEQLFVSQNPLVSQLMTTVWQQTIEVTCLSMALLRLLHQQHQAMHLSMDTLTLAALIHQIGVLPILAEAEKYPQVFAEPGYLNHAVRDFAAPIGVEILASWGFASIFVDVTQHWSDGVLESSALSYTDLVRLGAIGRQTFPQIQLQSALLQHYQSIGVISKSGFAQLPEVQQLYQDARAVFA